MTEQQLKTSIEGVYHALKSMHEETLYQLDENDTRPTHVSSKMYDRVELLLKHFEESGIF